MSHTYTEEVMGVRLSLFLVVEEVVLPIPPSHRPVPASAVYTRGENSCHSPHTAPHGSPEHSPPRPPLPVSPHTHCTRITPPGAPESSSLTHVSAGLRPSRSELRAERERGGVSCSIIQGPTLPLRPQPRQLCPHLGNLFKSFIPVIETERTPSLLREPAQTSLPHPPHL